MASFDKIPSQIEINVKVPKEPTVVEEIESVQKLLDLRAARSPAIKPLYKHAKPPRPKFTYRFFCVCPRYNPHYLCQHAGKIIIDRDVLTKDEHICFLATPKPSHAAKRKPPHYYKKKIVLPSCTSRIAKLAQPDIKRVKYTLELYKHILRKRQTNTLKKHLAATKPEVQSTNLQVAIAYIDEEKRLERVSNLLRRRECRRLKRFILKKQRKQIKDIINVLFEEMKDFLLNDQFFTDEPSALTAVILEHMRNFTNKEFYTTNNLREYQKILANNLSVWVNKFIANMNIDLAPPPPCATPTPKSYEPQSFVPVQDYISFTQMEDEHYPTDREFAIHDQAEEFFTEQTDAIKTDVPTGQ